ncbi:MAG: acyl-CoA dehydrogenase [Planctomycetota bacterium]
MSTYGILADAPTVVVVAGTLVVLLAMAFLGARLWFWTLVLALGMWCLGAGSLLWYVFVPVAAVLNLRFLRRLLFTNHLLRFMRARKLLPVISDTERTAIEAGTVWIDRELFSGKPNLKRVISEPYPNLAPEEQAFLDGPVEEVCRMADDWQIWQQKDLSQEVWTYLKEQRFFGMIIPKKYGGLEFSALAHSAVVQKLASRSLPLAISVMVPNSLGPAELLAHCGTEEQRKRYLPALAIGKEMPCFALTEPGAGSDAGSIAANGEVFRNDDGELMLRLNWNKRYITLASISTLLGLAFKLRDPENLLGKGENLGITCALVPSDAPGVDVGQCHDPLAVPFYKCPTTGEDVVVPVDAIIGGVDGAGDGWRMLMECLAAGRGISLPGTSTGGAKLVARVAGAYAAVRQQFGMAIGKFEGIEEPLSRIGGYTYIMEAARRYTCGALDAGDKPPVVTAMAKLNFTELYRKIINDGMDVCGGAAISRGPRNLLAHGYIGAPISITVEGANILTRTMIIFGQGAIRCHPHSYDEIEAAAKGDKAGFDKALFQHMGHVFRNTSRSLLLSLSRGRLASSPVGGRAAPYWRKLAWASASFALMADLAMGALGGDLKRKEKLTGRFADILSWMYLGTAVLRRFEAEGRQKSDVPFLHWAMQHAFTQIGAGFQGLFQNMDVPLLGWVLRWPVTLWTRLNPIGTPPSDRVGQQVARALQQPGEQRDRLTTGIFLPTTEGEALHRLEAAYALTQEAEPVLKKVKAAIRSKTLPKAKPGQLIEEAMRHDVITKDEGSLLRKAEAARRDAVTVDAFTVAEYLNKQSRPSTDTSRVRSS